MKKLLPLLLLSLLFLAACGKEEAASGDAAQGEGELMPITLVLDYTPNTNHTGLYVALDKGYYEEEGLELSIIQPPEDGAPALVASGKAQLGVDYQDTIAAGYAQENPLPVTNIAALLQHNTSGIISLAGGGMDRPKGLEGKRYATWGIETEQAILKNVVETDGGDFTKVELVPSNITDVFTGLQTDIDAVWIFEGWDGVAAELKGIDTDYFAFKDINPVFDYYTPTLIANNDFMEENPQVIEAFLRATKRGYEDAIADPKAAAQVLLAAAPELDPALVEASQEYLKDEYIADAPRWGEIDPARWNAFYSWLYEEGLITKEIPEDFGFTNEFLPE
ncbi:MAG: ABC transporter substrate-binding protein [Tissierellia bacterium]|nr:ABC transporter substrate-binding protein [Tissierellia bacterium]